MTPAEFFTSATNFFSRTDTRIAAIETAHGAALEVERGLRNKAESSLSELNTQHAKVTVQALELQAELDKAKADHTAELATVRASRDIEAGKKAAIIVAGAGFKAEVPAETGTTTESKMELWTAYHALPTEKRHAFYRKNRASMAD